MKFLRAVLTIFVLIGGLAWVLPSFAAEPTKQKIEQAKPEKDLILKGDAKCTSCHDEADGPQVLAISKTAHGVRGDKRNPTCTGCHGDSDAHIKNPEQTSIRPAPERIFMGKNKSPTHTQNEPCINCHKGGARMQWEGSQHESRDVSCVACHKVHAVKDKVRTKNAQAEVCFTCHKTQRAEMLRMSTHPNAAGKTGCSDCHNPHGSDGPKLMVENTVRDTCFTCHAEKRGPFLWEHPSAMDDCMNCHTPHGSTTAPLLKGRAPWLCQNCHGDGAPHPGDNYSAANLPGGARATLNTTGPVNPLTGKSVTASAPNPQLAFRACTNCHSQVHGSNHPSGQRFVR